MASVLDTEILNLEGNAWTTRDAATGVMVFGMTGSGKSSGPLRNIALKFLQLGYGGIVFCAKPDEPGTWEDYAAETGRTGDLLRLSNETFAFLDEEFSRPREAGGGQVENVVNIFLEVVKISKDKKQAGTSDEYWQNAIKQFLRNAISLLVLAKEQVTLPNIKKTIDTALRSNEVAENIQKYVEGFVVFCQAEADEYGDFRSTAQAYQKYYIELNGDAVNHQTLEHAQQYSSLLLLQAAYHGHTECPDYELAWNYFLIEFPQLDERTRSNTISSFTVLADSMLRGEFLRCFGARSSSLHMEELYRQGKILIVDQDVKQYGLVGQMTAAIIKLCFQKMIERREDITNPDARPVFLWADECQFFAIDYDQKFQTTARSSRTLTVYATQNLGNLHDGYGKEKAASLLGNLGTKFFCQNGDHETNKWAADSIGQEVIRRRSQNLGDSQSGGLKGDYSRSDNYSEGWSEQKDYKVDIVSFTTLQAGGPRGQCQVGYIFWQSGRLLKNGDVFVRSAFKQKCRKVCGARVERHCPATQEAGKNGNLKTRWFYWYDYCRLAVFTVALLPVFGGIWLIYSGNDCFIWRCPGIGIVTLATLGVWCAAFVLEMLWAMCTVGLELIWCAIRHKPRLKVKTINRMPLVVFTWMYLILSFALAVLLQNALYDGDNVWPFALVWIAASLAHRLFKTAGGRKIPVDSET